jgi:hypothetical protein
MEALSFGHGIALVLELGELPPPLLARCDFVRVLVEIIHVRAHYLDRRHAGATDPICKQLSGQEANADENGVDNFSDECDPSNHAIKLADVLGMLPL